MSNFYWLTDEQMERLEPYFPKSYCKPRIDQRRVFSGMVFVNRNRHLVNLTRGVAVKAAPSTSGLSTHRIISDPVSVTDACYRVGNWVNGRVITVLGVPA